MTENVPKLSGSFSPDWVGEGEEIAEDDGVEFDSVPLLPSTMKSVKSLIRITNESLRMSSQSLDSVLQARLVEDVQTKLDTQFWGSGGDGTTPKGVLHASNVAGMVKIDLAAAAITLDTPHDAFARRWATTSRCPASSGSCPRPCRPASARSRTARAATSFPAMSAPARPGSRCWESESP